MAVMTAAFATRQILGPLLVSIVAGDPRAMDLTLITAAVVPILGALVLLPATLLETFERLRKQVPGFAFLDVFKAPVGKQDGTVRPA